MANNALFAALNSKWIAESGPEADVVLTSRVRLARNLQGYPFPHLLTAESGAELQEKIKQLFMAENNPLAGQEFSFYAMADVEPLDRQVLVEKHLVSPDFARVQSPGTVVVVSDDEALSIMLGEEDHLRIQCLYPGFQLEECWQRAGSVDDYLESHLEYAFDQTRGYLTTCPTNVGTGLRASVMVHLPGLVLSQQIGRVLAAISQVGLAVRGLYGEGTDAVGNLFQISNQITLGPSEEELLQNLEAVIQQIVGQERAAQQTLLKKNRLALEDRVWRSFGLLTNARLLTSQEALRLLSDVRMGHDLGILQKATYLAQNELLVLTQPAMLQRVTDENMAEEARDSRRAALVRNKLKDNLSEEDTK